MLYALAHQAYIKLVYITHILRKTPSKEPYLISPCIEYNVLALIGAWVVELNHQHRTIQQLDEAEAVAVAL